VNNIDTLQLLQKAETDILVEFDRICEENKLKYYITFGTLLGAVRHHGFIPWDDDIDCYMPRNDYERLLEIGEKYFQNPYILNHYSLPYFNNFSPQLRIENHRVKVIRIIGNKPTRYNCWIDIFPMDGMPNNKIYRYLQIKRIDNAFSFVRIARSTTQGSNISAKRPLIERICIPVINFLKIGKLFDLGKMQKYMDEVEKKYRYEKSSLVHGYVPAYKGKCVYPKEWFEPAIKLEFDGYLFRAPAKYDLVLREIYGDYMKLPPKEKRISSHVHSVEFIE